jgi:hypothetical protein
MTAGTEPHAGGCPQPTPSLLGTTALDGIRANNTDSLVYVYREPIADRARGPCARAFPPRYRTVATAGGRVTCHDQ